MLCVDFVIISNCRNGLIIIIIKIKNVLNICQKVFETSQNSFFVTGKHRNTWSKYKHHHIVQEGGFMGLHYTSVNLTMVGNVSTTTTSTTLEDIEGVRSVRVYCGLLVVVIVIVVIVFVVIVYVVIVFCPRQQPAQLWRILMGWALWEKNWQTK